MAYGPPTTRSAFGFLSEFGNRISDFPPPSIQRLPRPKIALNCGMNAKYLKYLCLLPLSASLLLTGCVTRTYTVAPQPPAGPTLAEVQSMSQAHVSDSVIIAQIQNSSTRYRLTSDQIISLKSAGVSDAVINALINSASKPQPETTTSSTTVVEPYPYPYVYVDPWPWWGWGPYYYHGYYYHGYRHWR